MTSQYCLKCRKQTPSKDIHYENITKKTKSGKIVNQTMMKGTCEVCGRMKTTFAKASDNQSKMQGSGLTHRVEKRDMSKRTYTALKELIKDGKAGYLTFGNTRYYVSPTNLHQFKKAHEKGVLKKAAQIMTGEKTPQEVNEQIKAMGGGMDSLGILTDILGVVGMLL